MKLTEWREGKPPRIGWWNASVGNNADARRWWDGSRWSVAVFQDYSDEEAEAAKHRKTAFHAHLIRWRGLTEPAK
jgi:hypothetical protein